jgi:hypothetical protein
VDSRHEMDQQEQFRRKCQHRHHDDNRSFFFHNQKRPVSVFFRKWNEISVSVFYNEVPSNDDDAGR